MRLARLKALTAVLKKLAIFNTDFASRDGNRTHQNVFRSCDGNFVHKTKETDCKKHGDSQIKRLFLGLKVR